QVLAILDGDEPGALVRVAVADDHDRSVRVLDPDPRMDGVLAATDEILHPRRKRPHATNLRIWSIVQSAPRSTKKSDSIRRPGLLPSATLAMVSVLACHPWASSGVTSSGLDHAPLEIGRASCREGGCSAVAGEKVAHGEQ